MARLGAGGLSLVAFLLVLANTMETGQAADIIVGGKEHWHFGFSYAAWAAKAAPFFEKDVLVFMYDPPSNQTFPHSVYLFKDEKSFNLCNLTNAKMLASPVQGRGAGFRFVLKKRKKPYLFACGERGGFHCKVGMMKFAAKPLPDVCHG